MSSILPKALESAIESMQSLPGVGQRSAERYAAHLLRSNPSKAQKIADSLKNLHDDVGQCPVTFMLIDTGQDVSPLYSDERRDKQQVVIVEDAFDIVAIEKTGLFRGTYHVLGGLLSPIDGIDAGTLHIPELLGRIKADKVTEIILAISSSVEGDSTAHYIQSQLTKSKVAITRLARGLPIGLDIEYADHVTLSRAFEGRQAV